jgi:hypothetical protein
MPMIRATTLFLLSSVVLLSGCATRSGLPDGITRKTYCEIAKPITWSPADTRVTKEQVDIHNRLWIRLCRKK